MSNKSRMIIEGFDEMDDVLKELSAPLARAAMVRTLKRAAAPIRDKARQLAPKKTQHLEKSIVAGTKLNPRQSRLVRQAGKGFAEVYVGTTDPAGVAQEFGTFKEPAQPFMRPAWDGEVGNAMKIIAEDVKEELSKTAARAAARRLKKSKR